ncbi:HET-domain-containing protein [Colletotrichum eremochloae]|nr:HET-domain-containing protein [Colletotrichum eremochloae]
MDCLCQPCQSMLGLASAQSPHQHINRVDFQMWSDNALIGSCHLCTLLFYAAAGPHHQSFIDDYTAASYEIWAEGLGKKMKWNFGGFIDRNEGNYKYLALVETLSSESPKFQYRKQLEESIEDATVTAETIYRVLQWIEECSKNHGACQHYQTLAGTEYDLPLRLIDVDPEGDYLKDEIWKVDINLLSCEEATRACVRSSEEISSSSLNGVKYLTLSHRWGDAVSTELTWANIDEFRKQIPISSLSNTFKDAILITRCLGFRYLWIDSVCINQDDPVEKASEISRMHSIYKNSQLNLSATVGETGLIFPRNPLSVLPVLRKKNTTKFHAFKPAVEEYLMVSAGPWETFVDLGPLNDRAWVLQERLLAPRVLHCCYNMVYWECPCMRACEADPFGQMNYGMVTNSVDHRFNIKGDLAMASTDPGFVQGRSPLLSMDRFLPFYIIVRSHYFPRKLTYPCDRLPAISGIARWFMTRLGLPPESYLAGLWQETLPGCLLWHFFKPPKGEAVRDLEAGPSWSWASVIASSQLDTDLAAEKLSDVYRLFQNIRPIIVPRNGDRFAQLETAILQLHERTNGIGNLMTPGLSDQQH